MGGEALPACTHQHPCAPCFSPACLACCPAGLQCAAEGPIHWAGRQGAQGPTHLPIHPHTHPPSHPPTHPYIHLRTGAGHWAGRQGAQGRCAGLLRCTRGLGGIHRRGGGGRRASGSGCGQAGAAPPRSGGSSSSCGSSSGGSGWQQHGAGGHPVERLSQGVLLRCTVLFSAVLWKLRRNRGCGIWRLWLGLAGAYLATHSAGDGGDC